MYEIFFFLPHLWSELQSICHPGPLTLTWVLPHDSGRVNWPPVFCEQSKNRPFQLLQIWCLVHLCSIYFALGDSQIAKCMEKKSIQLQCWLICIQSRKCLKRCKPIYMNLGAGSVFCPCLYCKLNRSIVPIQLWAAEAKGSSDRSVILFWSHLAFYFWEECIKDMTGKNTLNGKPWLIFTQRSARQV